MQYSKHRDILNANGDIVNRHYNPEDGRWLTCDPIHKDGGLTLYGFVGNNPLLWSDFLGRSAYIKQGLSVQKDYVDAGVVAGDLTTAVQKIVLGPPLLLEGEVSLIYVFDKQGVDFPELCGDLVHVNEDTSTIDPMAEVQRGDTALLETRDDTSLSDMFKNIRFCQPRILELRSCDIGQQSLLKNSFRKKYAL